MARLTPIDYQMQVINPMAAALQGYQAGFGQMQQLDEVRRQREADEMEKQRFEAEMAEYERATAAAQAAQQLQADFYSGLADGTMTVSKAREFLGNPNISENIASAVQGFIEDKSEDQIRTQMHDIGRLTMLARNDPDGFNAEMDRRVEAAQTVGDQDQLNVLRGLRELSSDPAAGQAVGIQMLAGLAGQLGEEGETYIDAVFKQLDLDKPQSPLTTVGKLNADLAAKRITQDQFNAEIGRIQREEPELQLDFDESGQLRGVSFGTGGTPFTPTPEQARGKQPTPVTMPGTGNIVISPSPQQSAATKEFNTLAAFKAKNEIVRDEVAIALDLIEVGAGGVMSSTLREMFPNLTAGTATAALESRINTIRSNIGFNELSDMRQNSPTGGAVGSLSTSEFDNLAALLGELNVARPEELAGKLNRLVEYIGGMEQRAESALMANYADIITLETRQREVERQTTAAAGLSDEDLFRKYGVSE